MDSRPLAQTLLHGSREESGQALVEAAFVLPMMLFLILCILQLTLLQQARIMVEYAAFNAARTGIVHNMNNGVDGSDPSPGAATMRNAAVYSILPAWGRTDSLPALTATLAAYEVADVPMRAAGIPQIKVTVLSPSKAAFAAYGQHLNQQELDFDDMRPAVTPSTLLSIQVRYLFELRVPFADKMIRAIWLASQLGILSLWTGPNMATPTVGTASGPDAVNGAIAAGGALGIIQDGMQGGLNVTALSAFAEHGKFYMPVDAWYSMRMQSNPYLQWAAP